jgi:lipopolysaccharide transport system ATP-binding protein
MHHDLAISASNLGKRFRLFGSRRDRLKEMLHPFRRAFHEPFWALRDINVSIPRGQAVGVVGRNGSGKSTLLQILAGVMQPSTGAVRVRGRIGALLQLGAGFNPEFTGRENAMLNGVLSGLSESEMTERLPWIESFADLGRFFDQPAGTYSSGMFVRLGFAVSTCVLPDILIIDEALAVGDAAFQFKCFARIEEVAGHGGNLLLVSHDRQMLMRHCERGLLLDRGRLLADGPIREIINRYDELLFSAGGGARGDAGDAAAPFVPAAQDAEAFMRAPDSATRLSQRTHFNPDHFRTGDGRAEIIDFLLTDAAGRALRTVRAGQPLRLLMKVRFDAAVDGAELGMAVCTSDGVTLYRVNSHRGGRAGSRWGAPGMAVAEFAFHLPLLPGVYFINLGVYQMNGAEPVFVDVRRGLLRVELEHDTDAFGIVDLGCSISLPEPQR